jgi:hypothetical protein
MPPYGTDELYQLALSLSTGKTFITRSAPRSLCRDTRQWHEPEYEELPTQWYDDGDFSSFRIHCDGRADKRVGAAGGLLSILFLPARLVVMKSQVSCMTHADNIPNAFVGDKHFGGENDASIIYQRRVDKFQLRNPRRAASAYRAFTPTD